MLKASRKEHEAPASLRIAGNLATEEVKRLAARQPGLVSQHRVCRVVPQPADQHALGCRDESEPSANNQRALSQSSEGHVEQLGVLLRRARDARASAGDHIELEDVIHLRACAIACLTGPADAERSADR